MSTEFWGAMAVTIVGMFGAYVWGWSDGRLRGINETRKAGCHRWCDDHTRGLGLPEYQTCVARCADWQCEK